MNPTFASFLEPAGIIVAGGLVTAFIELLKNVFPALGTRVSGALQAFVITAVIYVLTAIATNTNSLDTALVVFAAWLACATAAVGIHSTVSHVAEVQKTP